MILSRSRKASTEDVLLLLLSRFSRVRLCDPIDGSPPGSSVPGILQARTLDWVAISFSNAWKWKVKVKSLSHARLLATPWTAAYQAPPSMRFSRQEYRSRVLEMVLRARQTLAVSLMFQDWKSREKMRHCPPFSLIMTSSMQRKWQGPLDKVGRN